MRRFCSLLIVLGLASFSFAEAQEINVIADDLRCIPLEDNAGVFASVEPEVPGSSVLLFFRRLHNEVEDFYYTQMHPLGNGRYWGVFPKPEDRAPVRKELDEDQQLDDEDSSSWALWWKAKEASDHRDPNDDLDEDIIRERASAGKLEARDWMVGLAKEELQAWLERQDYEAAEYFVGVHRGGDGVRAEQVESEIVLLGLVARSEMKVAPVTDECEAVLTAQQTSFAQNLTVGETANWQHGEPVFHWLCDGLVTRIDQYGIYRADEICRACVIAWWKRPGFLLPATLVGVSGGVAEILEGGDPDCDVTPFDPNRCRR